jgi:hypothetical protein
MVFALTRPLDFFGTLETFQRSPVWRGAHRLFEPEATTAWWVSLSSGARSMLRGTAKAIVVILAAIVLDEYFYNGLYTDAVISMLRDMRHSFRW